jgi:hypothetical protein
MAAVDQDRNSPLPRKGNDGLLGEAPGYRPRCESIVGERKLGVPAIRGEPTLGVRSAEIIESRPHRVLSGEDSRHLAKEYLFRFFADGRLGIDRLGQFVSPDCRGPLSDRLEPTLEVGEVYQALSLPFI